MKKRIISFLLAAALAVTSLGCGTSKENNGTEDVQAEVSEDEQSSDAEGEIIEDGEVDAKAPVIEGLTYESTVELEYAECFRIYRYEGGYSVIRIDDGRDYILIPEGGLVPEDLPESVVVMQLPLDNMYLQATSCISYFDELNAIDHIRLSGTRQEGWYVDGMIDAMESGDVLFAGKYSEPDFEMMISEGCDLALESTMILHNPEVLEKIEELGIPVFIERSSYEKHPLAKTEWVKVIGEFVGEPEAAQALFEEQKEYVDGLEDFENTEKTVAFFYVNTNGIVVTRKSADYYPKMIELAGGRYIFENLGDPEKATSGVNLSMEEFYASAKDADYIIYNASIDEPLNSVAELIEMNALFADFKAVKDGNVWTTGKSLHQANSDLGEMILDLNQMLTDDTAQELRFMHRLQ